MNLRRFSCAAGTHRHRGGSRASLLTNADATWPKTIFTDWAALFSWVEDYRVTVWALLADFWNNKLSPNSHVLVQFSLLCHRQVSLASLFAVLHGGKSRVSLGMVAQHGATLGTYPWCYAWNWRRFSLVLLVARRGNANQNDRQFWKKVIPYMLRRCRTRFVIYSQRAEVAGHVPASRINKIFLRAPKSGGRKGWTPTSIQKWLALHSSKIRNGHTFSLFGHDLDFSPP